MIWINDNMASTIKKVAFRGLTEVICQSFSATHPLSLKGSLPTYLSSDGIPLQGLGVAQEQLKFTIILKLVEEIINSRSKLV